MYATLRSKLDRRTCDIIQGCIHCTNITALCSILNSRKIDSSNNVRDGQKANSISRTILSRDLNKSGADGVYARFLLNKQTVTSAKYGASGARPVRIYMAKENCLDLQTISISMSDLKGNTDAAGNLNGLDEQTSFNAEVCFLAPVLISAFTSIYVKPTDTREIRYGNFPAEDKFTYSIAQIIVKVRNSDDFRAGLNKGRSRTEMAEENEKIVSETCAKFLRAGFAKVFKAADGYYEFTR